MATKVRITNNMLTLYNLDTLLFMPFYEVHTYEKLQILYIFGFAFC